MRHRTGRDGVVPAVKVPDKPDHLLLARVGAREAQREMRGFGTRRGEAHPFGAWDEPLHELRPAHLQLMRGAPVRTLRHLMLHGCDDRGMHVAKQERAMTAEI